MNAALPRHTFLLSQGLAIAFALFIVATNIFYIADAASGGAGLGTLGGSFSLDSADGRSFVTVGNVAPGSPLAQAGVKNGDRLHFDRPYDYYRRVSAGERIGFTVLGTFHHVDAVAAPLPVEVRQRNSRLQVIDGLSAIFASLIGLIVLIRARRTPSLIVLGLAFAGFDYTPGILEGPAGAFAVWWMVRTAIHFTTPLLFLDFALLFYRENVGPLARWVWPAFWMAAIVVILAGASTYWANIFGVFPVVDWRGAASAAIGVPFAAAIVTFFIGWRKGTPMLQSRYAIMLAGLSCFILSALILQAAYLFTDTSALVDQNFAVQAAFEVLATVAPLLFAYAVLRHKVLDLGFVVNRALVYGVVSTVLLVAFGIVEWASEHLLPIKNLETNALVDGGIALAIFLAFHRLRDLAEQVIEGLFFRAWRDNEAAMRRFVAEAAYIGAKQALTRAFIAELARFSGGANCALYLAGEGRGFVLAEGVLAGGIIDGDDPVVVALRAHGEPIEPSGTTSKLPAALALPMRQRGELTGFVLIGYKPSGEIWRPDERALLGWAAHQIGLDLHALKIEQLEEDAARLRQESAILAAQLALMRGLGAVS